MLGDILKIKNVSFNIGGMCNKRRLQNPQKALLHAQNNLTFQCMNVQNDSKRFDGAI